MKIPLSKSLCTSLLTKVNGISYERFELVVDSKDLGVVKASKTPEVKLCTCDFKEVVMTIGCQCGAI